MPHEPGHLHPQEYVDQALAAGIPIEVINTFLASNPGDYHRIISATAGPREQLQGQGLTNAQIYVLSGGAGSHPGGNVPVITPAPAQVMAVSPAATVAVCRTVQPRSIKA